MSVERRENSPACGFAAVLFVLDNQQARNHPRIRREMRTLGAVGVGRQLRRANAVVRPGFHFRLLFQCVRAIVVLAMPIFTPR